MDRPVSIDFVRDSRHARTGLGNRTDDLVRQDRALQWSDPTVDWAFPLQCCGRGADCQGPSGGLERKLGGGGGGSRRFAVAKLLPDHSAADVPRRACKRAAVVYLLF